MHALQLVVVVAVVVVVVYGGDSGIYIYIYIYVCVYMYILTTTTQCKLPKRKYSSCASGLIKKAPPVQVAECEQPRVQVNYLQKKHHQFQVATGDNHHPCKWNGCTS